VSGGKLHFCSYKEGIPLKAIGKAPWATSNYSKCFFFIFLLSLTLQHIVLITAITNWPSQVLLVFCAVSPQSRIGKQRQTTLIVFFFNTIVIITSNCTPVIHELSKLFADASTPIFIVLSVETVLAFACLIHHRLIRQFATFSSVPAEFLCFVYISVRQYAQFVTSFYPLEAFCSANTSFAVSLLMSSTCGNSNKLRILSKNRCTSQLLRGATILR